MRVRHGHAGQTGRLRCSDPVRGVLERDRLRCRQPEPIQSQQVDGRIRFVRGHLIACRQNLEPCPQPRSFEHRAHVADIGAARHCQPQPQLSGAIQPANDARCGFQRGVQRGAVRHAQRVARRPVVGRPDGLGERGVTQVVRVAAMVGEEAGRIEFQSVSPPLPAPALQQRGFRIHQQAVEIEDQRFGRHGSQYPDPGRTPTNRSPPTDPSRVPDAGISVRSRARTTTGTLKSTARPIGAAGKPDRGVRPAGRCRYPSSG
jgi:hypothetical protein